MTELRQHRAVIALVLAGVLVAVLVYGVYLPDREQIAKMHRENTERQQEIIGLTAVLQSADAANFTAMALAGERTATLDELYSVDSIEAFIGEFTMILEAMGLSNVYVSPVIDELLAPPTVELDGATLARLKFDVEAQGRFIAGGQALEALELKRYYVAIPHLSIEHDDGIAPQVLWTFQLLAHFRAGGRHDG